ncbi:MAG: hypothetical protein U0350_49240 [Caldilineaceae bacterium]
MQFVSSSFSLPRIFFLITSLCAISLIVGLAIGIQYERRTNTISQNNTLSVSNASSLPSSTQAAPNQPRVLTKQGSIASAFSPTPEEKLSSSGIPVTLQSFTPIAINTMIRLNPFVRLKILGAQKASKKDLDAFKGPNVSGDVIKPGNQGILIFYELTNFSDEVQQVVQGDMPAPMTILNMEGRDITEKEQSLLTPFSLAILSQIPPKQTIKNAFIFEITQQSSEGKKLFFVTDSPGFIPAKTYLPLTL